VKANLFFHEPEVVAIVRNNLYYFIELIWLERLANNPTCNGLTIEIMDLAAALSFSFFN
jgi:hypothetical protein